MYEDFTAFKLHVMKEFLFLKHLMENNGKMTESDINPVYKRLAAENESLKKENEKLKQWIDSLFDMAKVSKDKVEKYESSKKGINMEIKHGNSVIIDNPMPRQRDIEPINIESKDNEETTFRKNANFEQHHSITHRKRPAHTNPSSFTVNAGRKRTDEALSISQNFENFYPHNQDTLDNIRSTYTKQPTIQPTIQPIINDQPKQKEQRKRVVPGNRTYSDVVQYGKKIVIFGDSHMKTVNRSKLNFNINGKAQIKFFRGVNSEQLEYYVIPTVIKEKPDSVVIVVGSNDVNFDNVKYSNPRIIAEKILKVAEKCKELGVDDVTISSVFIKRNLTLGKFIRNLNIVLEKLCISRGFKFMNNDNITTNFVSDDGVHLDRLGTILFSENLMNCINRTTGEL